MDDRSSTACVGLGTGLFPVCLPPREGLNKCLLHFSDAQGESALSALLTFSVTYSHRKWWHIPVPREPLINQRFPRSRGVLL